MTILIYDRSLFGYESQAKIFVATAQKYVNSIYEYNLMPASFPSDEERIYFVSSHYDKYYMSSHEDLYSPASYMRFNESEFLNRDGIFIPVWKTKYINEYFNNKNDFKFIFVRPNSGKKEFTGQIFGTDDDIKGILNSYGIDDSFMLFVAPYKNIRDYEFRFHIINNKISTYSNTNAVDNICPRSLINYVEKIVNSSAYCYGEDGSYVLDIAIGSDGKYWIDEINSIFYSGFYKFADIEKFVVDFFNNR